MFLKVGTLKLFGWLVVTLTFLKLMSIGGSGEFPGSLVHFKLTGEGIDARFLTEHFRPIGPNHKKNSGVIYLDFKSKLIGFLKTIDN